MCLKAIGVRTRQSIFIGSLSQSAHVLNEWPNLFLPEGSGISLPVDSGIVKKSTGYCKQMINEHVKRYCCFLTTGLLVVLYFHIIVLIPW